MPAIALPSQDVPEHEKRAFSEAEVHSRLFAPDMEALGYPKVPPPFLILYTGKVGRNFFYRRRQLAEPTLLGELDYEELDEIWSWERIRSAHLFGEFEEEEVDEARLREILLYHLDRIEEDMDAPVSHAVAIVESGDQPPPLTQFGRWLVDRPEASRRMRMLYQRKRSSWRSPRRNGSSGR